MKTTTLIALASIGGLIAGALSIAIAAAPAAHRRRQPLPQPQVSRCCEFVAARGFEVPEPWTDAERKAWFDKLAHDTERDLFIQRLHDRATHPPQFDPCGSFTNPCHTVIDR